jgi:protein gp37
MADLFGDWVPDEWIDEVFQTCLVGPCHRYLFLTKNPKRYDKAIDYTANEERGFAQNEGYWDNFWFGTTINSQKDERRIVELLNFDEGHKFLSIEPLSGEIDLADIPGLKYPGCTTHDALEGKLYHLDDNGQWTSDNKLEWVIVGAQTGPGAKPPEPEWVQSIIDQCRDAGIPLFLKNNLNWPMRIQEFPGELDERISRE